MWQVNFPLNQELRIAFKEQIGPNIRFYVLCILFSADGVFILNDENRDCVTYNYRPFVSVFIHDCNWNERRIQFPSLKICHILWSVVNARGDSMICETKIQYKDVGVVARFEFTISIPSLFSCFVEFRHNNHLLMEIISLALAPPEFSYDLLIFGALSSVLLNHGWDG